jgi:hypothetical protein
MLSASALVRVPMVLAVMGAVATGGWMVADATTAADSDFAARCAARGVIRCFGFDDAQQVRPQLMPAWDGTLRAEVDSDLKASGGGALRFEVPSNSPANTSGSFWLHFAADNSVQFGEGEEFFVQWRQRFSRPFLETTFQGGGGWKQVIIGEGDRPGTRVAGSCTPLEVVVGNTYHRSLPQMYHSCGAKDGQYEPLQEPVVPSDFLLQNAIRQPGCLYSLRGRFVPPCVGYRADEWMTFQVQVGVGSWYRNDRAYRHDSTIRLWVAEEGQPSRLVIDYSRQEGDCHAIPKSQPPCQTGLDLVNTNPAARYGKVWLLPYNTGKNAAHAHPTGHVWYDELIISRQRIADPERR